jgi:hypothetical protein
MTIHLTPATTIDPRDAGGANHDRLCVTARTVLERMPDLVAEGLTVTGVATLIRHAKALADLQRVRALPAAALRTHAIALHQALTLLAGEQALTLALWIEDGLGAN